MTRSLRSDERGDLAIDSVAGSVGAAIVIPTMTAALVGLWATSTFTGEVTRNHVELADVASSAVISGDRFAEPTPYGPDYLGAVVWETTAEEGPAAPNSGELAGTDLPSTEQYWVNAAAPKQATGTDCSPANLPDTDCLVVSHPVTTTVGGFAVSEVVSASTTDAVIFSIGDNPAEVRYNAWLSETCEGMEIVSSVGASSDRREVPARDGLFVYGSVNFIGDDGLPVAAENASLRIESDCGAVFEDILIYEGPTRGDN